MQKFIISKEGELILGNVEFHFELLGKNYATGCWGGGFWRVDKESKTLILTGKSTDFGLPKWEYFKEPPVGYEDYKITYEGKEVVISKIEDPVDSYTKHINNKILENLRNKNLMIQQKVYLIILNLMMVMKSKQKTKKTPLENITLGKEEIKKPRTKQERLAAGETFVTSEKGNSMTPLIMSGQKHVLEPVPGLDSVKVGDIVYCKVHGRFFTHLIKAIDPIKGAQIGNNHGHINGWTKNIYGKVIKVLKPDEKWEK